jgi:hypothetical protein
MRNGHEFPHSESPVGTCFLLTVLMEVLSSCAQHHSPLQGSSSPRPLLSPRRQWRRVGRPLWAAVLSAARGSAGFDRSPGRLAGQSRSTALKCGRSTPPTGSVSGSPPTLRSTVWPNAVTVSAYFRRTRCCPSMCQILRLNDLTARAY